MIELNEISFGYNSKKLLYKDLSIKLEQGKIYGLLGKNGAGKSTLLKSIAGLLFPLTGKVFVGSHEPRKRLPSFLKTIFFIPEEVYVPALSVKKYVALISPFYPEFNKEQLDNYLSVFAVNNQEKLHSMSFGQQKKFIIAFALACNTPVLLLDEPTNGLDIPSKKQFRKVIASVMTNDKTILISTHQIRDLDNLIDQVIIIDEGKLLLNAPVSQIGERLTFKTVQLFAETSGSLYTEETVKGIAVVMANGNRENSRVDLEHLFNAVTDHPDRINNLFES